MSKGLIEALSVKEARERLAEEGILAEHISPAGGISRLSSDTRSVLYRELASLLKAGLPIVKALDILLNSPEMLEVRPALAALRDRITEGVSLASALGSTIPSVTFFECAILDVGEKSAALESNLARLADYLDEQSKLQERIRSALTYPAFVVGLGVCSGAAMLGILVPMMQGMLLKGNIPLPALTRAMVALGGALTSWPGLAGVVSLVAGVVWFRRTLNDNAAFRKRMSQMIFDLPWIGRGYSMLVSLRFSRTLSVLFRSGVSLVDGMAMAGRATGNLWITEMAVIEADSVRHGDTLSRAVLRIPPLSRSLSGWIQTGEATGELAAMLENAANRYQEHWNRYINRSMGILAPVLILLVGGFVLLLALSVLLPVFSLSQTLGQ